MTFEDILSNYSDLYILVKGIIKVTDTSVAATATSSTNEKAIFKSCALFTDCIDKISSTQINNAKDNYVVLRMLILIEYSGNYSKTSKSLCLFGGDKAALDDNGIIFVDNDTTDLFKFKNKITNRSNTLSTIDFCILSGSK